MQPEKGPVDLRLGCGSESGPLDFSTRPVSPSWPSPVVPHRFTVWAAGCSVTFPPPIYGFCGLLWAGFHPPSGHPQPAHTPSPDNKERSPAGPSPVLDRLAWPSLTGEIKLRPPLSPANSENRGALCSGAQRRASPGQDRNFHGEREETRRVTDTAASTQIGWTRWGGEAPSVK